ncbi:ribosome maturation factor RimM [uncultured Jatrophihabitans sp.]|uniref:ribosome maturation factor RimM n=1 Tax=uncultured Jatrophihabitans sp. TaxID=1610747 RepID=UPI0035C94FAE
MDAARDAAPDLVAVGKVGPPRGVRGDVFVEPWTDAPGERFVAGAWLRTEPESAGPLRVATATTSSGKLVVHFDGCDDRAAAQAIRGVQLFVPAAERPALDDPDEFYDTDLIGLVARTPDGREIGTIRDVQHAGGASYLAVEVAGAQRLVPFVSAIVPAVDIAGATVVVDAPEGLFEL